MNHNRKRLMTLFSSKMGLVLLIFLLATPLVIVAGPELGFDQFLYLPVIMKDGETPNGTATPSATATATATATETASVTPGSTATLTPTLAATATLTPSLTPSATATDTPPPEPACGVQFEGPLFAGQNYVQVTGDIDVTVTIYDLTANGLILGMADLIPVGGHACPGFAAIDITPHLLIVGHTIAAYGSDMTLDTALVYATPTPGPTNTPDPSITPTITPTPDPDVTPTTTPTMPPPPTPTPNAPYIIVSPNCGNPPTNPGEVTLFVAFYGWPVTDSLSLFWDDVLEISWAANEHPTSFTVALTKSLPQEPLTYVVLAEATGSGHIDAELFEVPCPATPTPTITVTPPPTTTPGPADLTIGVPQLISTPPIVAYQPLQFSLPITNGGPANINDSFFVDVYLDPGVVLTTTIPLTESDGYTAIAGLNAGQTQLVTVTAPLGFTNNPATHLIYGMVDSVEQISELDETNNLSQPPLTIPEVTPAVTPIPTATPAGNGGEISGGVFIFDDELTPVYRALVTLIDYSGDPVYGTTLTDETGYYAFEDVPDGTIFALSACITIDNVEWYGFVTGVVAPNTTTHIIMFEGPCS